MAAPNQNEQPQQDAQSQQDAHPYSSAPSDDGPILEYIHVLVAFDVTKDNMMTRYTEPLHIPHPDTYEVFKGRLRAMHWWMQATQGEVWSWVSPDPFVIWIGTPYETTMSLETWKLSLRLIHGRNMGDYIRIPMKYERKGLD
ncbi:hypothetical protein DBV05_g1266 [Lasiodiplodia theobromae]|uniref:Uncharacterized protein n=1 Tax=Lasiodiplodia theobromae TaxID=45133 RepID=A0A5N5DVL7_9PEZI|nr:hypothetical protein DBV05_g1266 [Lasiodiplodia theobromae]